MVKKNVLVTRGQSSRPAGCRTGGRIVYKLNVITLSRVTRASGTCLVFLVAIDHSGITTTFVHLRLLISIPVSNGGHGMMIRS